MIMYQMLSSCPNSVLSWGGGRHNNDQGRHGFLPWVFPDDSVGEQALDWEPEDPRLAVHKLFVLALSGLVPHLGSERPI